MSIASEIGRIQNAKSSIKTAIESKGVIVGDGTIDTYANKINEITGGGDNTDLIKLIDRTIKEFNIPSGVTTIGTKAFSNCDSMHTVTIPESVTFIGAEAFRYSGIGGDLILPTNLTTLGSGSFGATNITSVTIPSGITKIGDSVCEGCKKLANVVFPENLVSIGQRTFYGCTSLTNMHIPYGVTSISTRTFGACTNLIDMYIPSTITSVGGSSFEGCTKLQTVKLGDGKETFNANGLNLSASSLYTANTILSWLDALADRTGLTTYTLTIGTANLAKLTEEQKAIATSKNWNLA